MTNSSRHTAGLRLLRRASPLASHRQAASMRRSTATFRRGATRGGLPPSERSKRSWAFRCRPRRGDTALGGRMAVTVRRRPGWPLAGGYAPSISERKSWYSNTRIRRGPIPMTRATGGNDAGRGTTAGGVRSGSDTRERAREETGCLLPLWSERRRNGVVEDNSHTIIPRHSRERVCEGIEWPHYSSSFPRKRESACGVSVRKTAPILRTAASGFPLSRE